MADKIYQKRNGQLVEVSAGGSVAGSISPATASSLGGIIVGSGLSVESNGKASVSGGYVSGIVSSYVASGGYTISGNLTVTGTVNGTATSATSAGNASKVNNLTVSTAVPANAKFTDTVYTHPTHTAKAAGLYKVTVDGQGHVTAAAAVTKADITALGIPGSDTNTTYAVFTGATSAANGAAGLVPAPTSAQYGYLLKGNKSWVNPSTLTVSSAAVATSAGTCTGTAAKATAIATASAYTVDNVQSAVTLPSGGTWFYMAWANSSPLTKVGSGAGGAVVYSKGKAPAVTVSEETVRSVRVVAFRKA